MSGAVVVSFRLSFFFGSAAAATLWQIPQVSLFAAHRQIVLF